MSAKALADALPGLLWTASPDCRIAFVNARFASYTGLDPKALAGSDWCDIIHPEELPHARERLAEAVRTGEPFEAKWQLRRHDGTYLCHLVHLVPHDAKDGKSDVWIGTAIDISDRQDAEQALARARQSLEVALEGAEAARWVINLATNEVEWSPQSYRQLGLDPGSVNPSLTAFSSHTHPDDHERLEEVRAKERSAEPGARFQLALRIVKADGQVRWIDRRSIVGPDEPDGRRVFGVDFDITARKRVEDQLRASEERLRHAVELVGLSTFEWDPSADVLQWDDRLRAMWGLPPGIVANRQTFRSLVHAEDSPAMDAAMERALDPAGTGEYAAEFRVDGMDGRLRWISARGRTSFAHGKPVSFIGAALDVTRAKETEQALKGALAYLDAVYESAPVGLCVIGRDGRYQRVNAQLAEINGETIEAHIGRHLREIVPYVADRVEPVVQKVIATGEAVYDVELEGETKAMPGVRRHWLVHMSPVRDDLGRVTAVNIVTEEITEKKRAAEALAREQRFTRGIIEASPAIIYVFDIRTEKSLFISRRAASVLGYTFAEFEAMGPDALLQLIHPDDRVRFTDRLGKLKAGPEDAIIEIEYRLARKDGSWAWFLSRARVVAREGGEPSRLVGIATDITERKAAETRQKVLLAELSHRVKNTLAVVQSVARQTFARVPEARVARQDFEARLMAMAQAHDILTAENWEGAPLRALVEAAMAPLLGATNERLLIEGPDLKVTPRFAVALSMALHELGTNAIKYGALSNETGHVSVVWTVTGRDPDRVLDFVWSESGGPPVTTPERRGFGSTLIELNLASELGTTVELNFEPQGVVCAVRVPLAAA